MSDLVRNPEDRFSQNEAHIIFSFHIQNVKHQTSLIAEQVGLCSTWSETPETGFLETRLIKIIIVSVDIVIIINHFEKNWEYLFTFLKGQKLKEKTTTTDYIYHLSDSQYIQFSLYWFVSDLVENMFSHNAAHLNFMTCYSLQSIDSMYPTESVNVCVPSERHQFR